LRLGGVRRIGARIPGRELALKRGQSQAQLQIGPAVQTQGKQQQQQQQQPWRQQQRRQGNKQRCQAHCLRP